MKRTTKNLLIAVTAIVGIICIVNAVWLIVQSGSVAGWFTDYRNIVYGDGAAENGSKIVWRDNVLGWQYFIFYGRLLFGIAFDALLLLFMIKSILVLKSGAFFLKSNTYILISAAVCNLLYNFCNENIRILIYDTYKKTDSPSKLTAMAIIVNIDIMLARRKMSSGELAAKVGITPANLSILKTGKARAIRFTTLEALCRALDCQPGDILEYREDSH